MRSGWKKCLLPKSSGSETTGESEKLYRSWRMAGQNPMTLISLAASVEFIRAESLLKSATETAIEARPRDHLVLKHERAREGPGLFLIFLDKLSFHSSFLFYFGDLHTYFIIIEELTAICVVSVCPLNLWVPAPASIY
jgi:hypothetical protein